MTEAEARERCDELNASLGQGEPPWTAREVEPGDWRPVRPRMPSMSPREPYRATTEAKPKPPEPEDPRDSFQRGIPGYLG
jgi:hypothetical protein